MALHVELRLIYIFKPSLHLLAKGKDEAMASKRHAFINGALTPHLDLENAYCLATKFILAQSKPLVLPEYEK